MVAQLSHALGLDATHALMLNSSPERLLLPVTDPATGRALKRDVSPSKGAAFFDAVAAGKVNLDDDVGGSERRVDGLGRHVTDGPRVSTVMGMGTSTNHLMATLEELDQQAQVSVVAQAQPH